MRLLHIHMGYEGGAERFFVSLANAFSRAGHEQAALIRPRRSWRGQLPAAMRVEESDYRRWWISRFSAQAAVRRLMREIRPEGVLAWMPRAAELLPPASNCLRATRLGDYPNPKAYWKFRHTDVIVCNTPDVADWTVRNGWAGRVEVISNFTDVSRTLPAPRAAHATPPDAFLIIAVGRLVELKGHHVLVRAMARLPSAQLWIVGEGDERPRLEAQIRELGLAHRCHLLGWKDDPAPYLAAADAVCLPSMHETLGNSVLEGWGAGRPVVASRTPGPSWLVRDGENGLLFPVGDDGALAECLERLRTDPSLRRRLAAAATDDLAGRFSETAVIESYIRLFRDCPSSLPAAD